MTEHRIITREEWGARPPKRVGPALVDEPHGVVHNIGGGPMWPSDPKATLRQIQRDHLNNTEEDYADIAYNFGVDRAGLVYVLRGSVCDGATFGYSCKSLSILAICNASAPGFVPTPELLDGIAWCFNLQKLAGALAGNAEIDGHRDLNPGQTECPGALEQSLTEIRLRMAQPPPALPDKVPAMYEPPLVLEPIRADCACPSGGSWAVAESGAVYAFGGAPYLGGANGQPWFVGRRARRIEARRYRQGIRLKWGYQIVAQTGETYKFPLGT